MHRTRSQVIKQVQFGLFILSARNFSISVNQGWSMLRYAFSFQTNALKCKIILHSSAILTLLLQNESIYFAKDDKELI